MPTFGDVAAPATNLVGSIISTIAAKKAQERENAHNKQMAEYSYSKDLEMWNRQNQYNAPESQMERFKDAGLNPNLIYGQGNAGNAATLPKYNAPTLREKTAMPDISGVLSSYQDYQLKQANIDIATEQKRMLQEKIASESVNRALNNSRWINLANQNRYWHGTKNDFFGQPSDTNYSVRQNFLGNTAQQKWMQSNQATTLSKYSWQIAKQNLNLLEKQNKYYFWNNVGSGVVKGATNLAGRFLTGAKGAGKISKGLKSPIKKKMSFSDIRKMQRTNRDILPNYNF